MTLPNRRPHHPLRVHVTCARMHASGRRVLGEDGCPEPDGEEEVHSIPRRESCHHHRRQGDDRVSIPLADVMFFSVFLRPGLVYFLRTTLRDLCFCFFVFWRPGLVTVASCVEGRLSGKGLNVCDMKEARRYGITRSRFKTSRYERSTRLPCNPFEAYMTKI